MKWMNADKIQKKSVKIICVNLRCICVHLRSHFPRYRRGRVRRWTS